MTLANDTDVKLVHSPKTPEFLLDVSIDVIMLVSVIDVIAVLFKNKSSLRVRADGPYNNPLLFKIS